MGRKGNRDRTKSESKHDRAGLKGTRGNAKKGGAGGGFTWGKPGDEMVLVDVDRQDPNYESDPEKSLSTGSTELDLEKQRINRLINQLFLSEDITDLLAQLDKNFQEISEVTKQVILISSQKKQKHRQIASKTLLHLSKNTTAIQDGFELLLSRVDDYALDIPQFPTLLAYFLARAVVDEVIPPSFLTHCTQNDVTKHARDLLSVRHAFERLENIWGVDHASLSALKKQIKLLWLEYFESMDVEEAVAVLKELDVEYFHHEVIKRGVVLALEKTEKEQAMVSCLFKKFKGVISEKQFCLGFRRVQDELQDLVLDNPKAKETFDVFIKHCTDDECIPHDFAI